MAQVLTPIAAVDLRPNQGIGIDLPFDGNRLFDINYLTKDQVRANLLNLFLTSPGERLQNPNFGVGLRSLLFENDISEEKIRSLIADQVAVYVPEVNVIGIELDLIEDENRLNIKFIYNLIYEEKPQQLEITLQ
jgi:phage baseplate assembly protein W